MSAEASTAAVVPISLNSNSGNPSKQPVWSLESANGGISPPLQAKCDRHGRRDGVCCKDLKDDDDRTLIDPDVVRDV